MEKKLGRKPVEIDMAELETLMRFKPRLEDAAAFFKCSEDTIERRIKDVTGFSFAEFRQQNMVHTRFNLVRKAIEKGERGDNVMLIFCLKNLCGWKDKPEQESAEQMETRDSVMTFELMERIKQIKGEV